MCLPRRPRRFPALSCLAGLATIAVCLTTPVSAQYTLPLPPGDLAYRDLDRLEELGLLESAIIGQRPYSYREVGRLVLAARVSGKFTRDSRERALVEGILTRLERRFGPGIGSRPYAGVEDVAIGAVNTDAWRRAPLGSFGRGAEATIDPLARRRLGEPAPAGLSLGLESGQWTEPISGLAFHARERLEVRAPRDDSISRRRMELLVAAMRLRVRNLAVTVGREPLWWTQSEGDGLFLARDAPALDLISVSGDVPFMLPGALTFLGPTQATLALADLGPSRDHSHSKLLVYKVSTKPAGVLELGATFMNHYGGEGARSSRIGDRLIDFLPFVDIFRTHNYFDTTRTLEVESDKLLGADWRVRIERLGGLSLSGEVLIDDFDRRRIGTLLTYDGSQTIRAVLPWLGTSPLSLALFATHMGIRTYTHGQLTDGITSRGQLLGDELGPNVKAFGGHIIWAPSARFSGTLAGHSAIYSDADYSAFFTDSARAHFIIVNAARRPSELRDQIVASVTLQPDDRRALFFRIGGQRVRNAPAGTRHGSYVAEVSALLRAPILFH